jgi:aryl carrier-like protein
MTETQPSFPTPPAVRDLVAGVLQKQPSELRDDARLVDLGLDSVTVLELEGDLQHLHGVRLDLRREILSGRTLGELIQRVASGPGPAIGPALPVNWQARLSALTSRADAVRAQGLYAFEGETRALSGSSVEVGGRSLLMLASYSYLGLLGHAKIAEAAREGTDRRRPGRPDSGTDHGPSIRLRPLRPDAPERAARRDRQRHRRPVGNFPGSH